MMRDNIDANSQSFCMHPITFPQPYKVHFHQQADGLKSNFTRRDLSLPLKVVVTLKRGCAGNPPR